MAYNYLGLTNEVLARMNEVELTASNFVSGARGFQVQCKNAVNDAINYINQREFGWPALVQPAWNHAGNFPRFRKITWCNLFLYQSVNHPSAKTI